jgi:hypothetical protein
MEASGQLHAPAALSPVTIKYEDDLATQQLSIFLKRDECLAHAPNRTMAAQLPSPLTLPTELPGPEHVNFRL